MKAQFEGVIEAMKEDMRRIREEWERRVLDEQLERERKVVEL